MRLQRDWREFIELLNSESVEYAIVADGLAVLMDAPGIRRTLIF
jgi:hypothetical protein